MSKPKRERWTVSATLLAVIILLAALAYLYVQGELDLGTLPTPLPGSEAAVSDTTPTRIAKATPGSQLGLFDFYVLALSWSPDYCTSPAGASDIQQCSVGRRLGFVLHGLWPQYNRGYPSNCSATKLPADVKAKFPGLYPSPALYDHEWEKHGTCSGLMPEEYLALSKQIRDSVTIPARYQAPEQPLRVTTVDLKKDFTAANPGLDGGRMAVMCSGSGRYLQALYVCFFADGKPATCSSEIARDANRSCQRADILVRNVR